MAEIIIQSKASYWEEIKGENIDEKKLLEFLSSKPLDEITPSSFYTEFEDNLGGAETIEECDSFILPAIHDFDYSPTLEVYIKDYDETDLSYDEDNELSESKLIWDNVNGFHSDYDLLQNELVEILKANNHIGVINALDFVNDVTSSTDILENSIHWSDDNIHNIIVSVFTEDGVIKVQQVSIDRSLKDIRDNERMVHVVESSKLPRYVVSKLYQKVNVLMDLEFIDTSTQIGKIKEVLSLLKEGEVYELVDIAEDINILFEDGITFKSETSEFCVLGISLDKNGNIDIEIVDKQENEQSVNLINLPSSVVTDIYQRMVEYEQIAEDLADFDMIEKDTLDEDDSRWLFNFVTNSTYIGHVTIVDTNKQNALEFLEEWLENESYGHDLIVDDFVLSYCVEVTDKLIQHSNGYEIEQGIVDYNLYNHKDIEPY